jgi:formate/nitrite transporter FocA (FNT family)
VSYLVPTEFVTKMIDAGEAKIFMSTRDTVVRAYMAGAILALAAWFAVTINVATGQPLVGALLFPVGFVMLNLLGFDLLTGVFVLTPLALLDRRPGVTVAGIMRNWGLVFVGNFVGALTVAFMMAFVTTFGFTQAPDKVGTALANIGEARTLGYASHGFLGMLTLFIRGVLCNWMVSTGVVGAMISTTVPGKVIAMWMPILVFFYMVVFEHSVVNMFLFPAALMLHAPSSPSWTTSSGMNFRRCSETWSAVSPSQVSRSMQRTRAPPPSGPWPTSRPPLDQRRRQTKASTRSG